MNYLQHDIFFFTDLLNCSLVRRIIGKPATGVNNRIFCSIYTKRCFVKQSVEKYFSANCADFSLDGQNSLQVEVDESLLGEPRFDCPCKHIIDPKTAFDSCNDRHFFFMVETESFSRSVKIGNNENICCRKDQDPFLSISAFNLQKEIKMYNY